MARQTVKEKQISYKSNSRYEPERFCRSFDGWLQARRDGDKQQMERCINEIYDYLRNFIYYTLWRQFPQLMANEEASAELTQNFWLEVMKALPGYDYRKARITTYLAPYAHVAGRAYYRQRYHTTGYYADVRGAMEKVTNNLQLQGEEEPGPETLARLTGFPKKAVERVCEEMRMDNMPSLEASFAEIYSIQPSQEGIPEKVILQQELKEVFGRFQEKLSGEEALLLETMQEMDEKGQNGLSCWKIGIYLNDKTEEGLASCKKKYSCCKIKGLKERLQKKLLWDRETHDYSCVYKKIG